MLFYSDGYITITSKHINHYFINNLKSFLFIFWVFCIRLRSCSKTRLELATLQTDSQMFPSIPNLPNSSVCELSHLALPLALRQPASDLLIFPFGLQWILWMGRLKRLGRLTGIMITLTFSLSKLIRLLNWTYHLLCLTIKVCFLFFYFFLAKTRVATSILTTQLPFK